MFSGASRSPVSLLLPAAYTTWVFTRRNTPVSRTTKPAERRVARSGRNTSAPPLKPAQKVADTYDTVVVDDTVGWCLPVQVWVPSWCGGCAGPLGGCLQGQRRGRRDR
jgi:hypothetical protein